MVMEEKILIDKETLKAIAVETRLNILKLLTQKEYTLSDLSGMLGLGNSTVKEHLDTLCKAGLIKKEETDRKWKYYSLTFKGKRLVQPREVKVLFAFAFSLIATIGVAVAFVKKIFFQQVMMKATVVEEAVADNLLAAPAREPAFQAAQASSQFPTALLITLIILIALSALLLGIYLKEPTFIINKGRKKE